MDNNDLLPFARWLTAYVLKTGQSQRAIARELDLSHQTLSNAMLAANRPELETVRKIARWMAKRDGRKPRAIEDEIEAMLPPADRGRAALPLPTPEFAKAVAEELAYIFANRRIAEARTDYAIAEVPRVDVRLSAGLVSGAGSAPGSTETVFVPVPSSAIGHELQVYTVSGDCMTRGGYEPGDEVLVDRSRSHSWREGDVVAIDHDGELLIKRVKRGRDGRVELAADDGTRVRPTGETHVVGVVLLRLKPP